MNILVVYVLNLYNYGKYFQVLDATFDDLVTLAIPRMPVSWSKHNFNSNCVFYIFLYCAALLNIYCYGYYKHTMTFNF